VKNSEIYYSGKKSSLLVIENPAGDILWKSPSFATSKPEYDEFPFLGILSII
jgi:hypothetical protein